MSYTAKSVIFDIADGHGSSELLGIRSIEFKLSNTLISLTTSDFTSYATSEETPEGTSEYAFTTSLSKTGSAYYNSMLFAYEDLTNLRLIIVFASLTEFDEIVINNYHHYGGGTSIGFNNVKIYTSDSSVTNTTYGNGISGYDLIFNSTFSQHAESDAADDISLTLLTGGQELDNIVSGVPLLGTPEASTLSMDIVTESPELGSLSLLYLKLNNIIAGSPVLKETILGLGLPTYTVKAVIIDIADNYGGTSLGIRSIEFALLGTIITLISDDFESVATSDDGTNWAPRRIFITSLSKTGSAIYNSWKTGYTTNRRITINFDSIQTFDSIIVNNYHDSGANTNFGAKNVKIYTTTNSVLSTVYEQNISAYDLIYDGTFAQHPVSNSVNNESLTLIPPPHEPNNIVTGAPVLDSIVVKTMDISAGTPILESLSLLYLVPDDIVTGIPVLDSFNITVPISPEPIISGIPELDSVSVIMTGTQLRLDLEIPISFEMSSGNNIDLELESFIFTGDLFSGRYGDFDLTFPKLNLVTYSGGIFNTALESFTFTGTINKEELGNINISLPKLSLQSSGSFSSSGNLIQTLPFPSLIINSLSGNTGSLSLTLPKINFINSILTGNLIDFYGNITILQMDITSIITGDNEINIDLFVPELEIDSEGLACYTLGYVKGAVR